MVDDKEALHFVSCCLACTTVVVSAISTNADDLIIVIDKVVEVTKIKQSVLICIGIILVLVTAGTAVADTFTVNNSAGSLADFTSIQDALDDIQTNEGDTILVQPGTYVENVKIDDVADTGLNIIAEYGPDVTVVQAANPHNSVL